MATRNLTKRQQMLAEKKKDKLKEFEPRVRRLQATLTKLDSLPNLIRQEALEQAAIPTNLPKHLQKQVNAPTVAWFIDYYGLTLEETSKLLNLTIRALCNYTVKAQEPPLSLQRFLGMLYLMEQKQQRQQPVLTQA